MINDLHASSNRETQLVEFVLRRSKAILEQNLDNLSSELLGYLLPYGQAIKSVSMTALSAPPQVPNPSAVTTNGAPPGSLESGVTPQEDSLQMKSYSAPTTSASKSSSESQYLYPNIKYLLDQCDREAQNNTFIPIFPFSSLSVNYSLVCAVNVRDRKVITFGSHGAPPSRSALNNPLLVAADPDKAEASVAYDVTFRSTYFLFPFYDFINYKKVKIIFTRKFLENFLFFEYFLWYFLLFLKI